MTVPISVAGIFSYRRKASTASAVWAVKEGRFIGKVVYSEFLFFLASKASRISAKERIRDAPSRTRAGVVGHGAQRWIVERIVDDVKGPKSRIPCHRQVLHVYNVEGNHAYNRFGNRATPRLTSEYMMRVLVLVANSVVVAVIFLLLRVSLALLGRGVG